MSLGLGKEASAKLAALLSNAKGKNAKPASTPVPTSKGKTPASVLKEASKQHSVKQVLSKAAAKAEARRKANLIATAKHNKRGGSQLLNQDQVDELIARAEKERKSVIIYNSYAAKGVPYTYTPDGVDPEDMEAYVSDPEHDPTYYMTDKEYNKYMDEVWKARNRQKDPVAEKALQKEVARYKKANETGKLPEREEDDSDAWDTDDLPNADDSPAPPSLRKKKKPAPEPESSDDDWDTQEEYDKAMETGKITRPQKPKGLVKKPAPEEPPKKLEEEDSESESESESEASAEENEPKPGTSLHGNGPPPEQSQDKTTPVVEAEKQKVEAPLKKKRRPVPRSNDDSEPPHKKTSSGTSNPWMALFGK